MGHRAPRGIVAITLLLIVWQWESILAIETSDCSCYSFHKIRKNWEDSNKICQQNNGRLVSMETEEEYQFINKTIQSLDVGNNEWYIGLKRISSISRNYWEWINGHSMAIIDKWVKGEPSGNVDCVTMIKHYNGRELFDDINCRTLRMFICEYKQAQKCSNITSTIIEKRCFSKRKQVTTKENTMTPSFSPTAKETSDCSCYSFHHITKSWEDSNKICQENGGTLVSMETEEEYQFINKTIQSLDVGENEWYIGLRRISTNYWRWNSGHVNKTIDKWMSGEPSRSDRCVKMIKHYKGRGLFDDIRCDIQYMFICEYKQAQHCPNITSTINKKWCSSQKKQITTSKEHIATTPFSPTSKGTILPHVVGARKETSIIMSTYIPSIYSFI
ncbi:macrophage mannose receptor 1-like [Actinia tenebrosa]|uniref:Macrophage mannose receptor 1-like n=1 Tax=Actinia tenebrosa TaxID=6105 RepID=A0A6P8IPM8_ACTTE|nr:macrophage mannose receptor 1-like [Actinia tenebrosa]